MPTAAESTVGSDTKLKWNQPRLELLQSSSTEGKLATAPSEGTLTWAGTLAAPS